MFSRRPSPPSAPGTRPPPVPLVPWLRLVAWLLLIGALLLVRYEASLTAWAEPIVLAARPAALGQIPSFESVVLLLLAHGLLALFAPPVQAWLILALWGAAGLLLIESLIRGALTMLRRHSERRFATVTLRVRAAPLYAGAVRSALADLDLLRSLHGLFPASPIAALLGRAPWLTLFLHAHVGEPVALGIVIAGGTLRQREALVHAVRAALIGHAPGTLVEVTRTPLTTVPSGPGLLVWRRFRMAAAHDVPLRTLDASDQDPLALLASALRPSTTQTTELHLALRPLRGWMLTQGWRAAGLRRLLRLQQKADHALSMDAKRLEQRLSLPAFAAELRVLVIAREPDARVHADAAVRQISQALQAYAERTGGARQALVPAGGGTLHLTGRMSRAFAALRARHAPAPAVPGLLLPYWSPPPPIILSIAELVGFWHLPTRATADLVQTTSSRYLPAPRQSFQPPPASADAPRPAWIQVGTALRPDGTRHPVGLLLSDLRYVLHLTAGMGAGKSRLLANVCLHLMAMGYVLIDGKGDDGGGLTATVLQMIPLSDEDRVILLDPRDARWPVGLNPLAGSDLTQPGAIDLMAANIFALFARIDPETWGGAQGMRDFLDKSLRLVLASEPHPTLANVKQALLDDAYRTRLLEHCHNRDVADYWRIVFPRLAESQRTSRDALLRRFDKLLGADLLRLMITQPTPAFSFRTAIEAPSIVLVPIPNVALGDLAGVYAMLVFQQFLRAAFARPGTDQTRRDYPLIIDELQVLIAEAANDDVETALSRLRSLAVPLVIAHQALSQLGAVEPLVQINAENRIILKTREPDASSYARQYGHHGLTAADIANQDPNEHQYALLRCGGEPAGPFSMAPLPWPKPQPQPFTFAQRQDWHRILPATSSDPLRDRRIAQDAYHQGSADAMNQRAEALAQMPVDAFASILARWEAIRQTHVDYLAQHPQAIPDVVQRIRWRSRLRYGMPYVFAEAIYRRARPALTGESDASGRRRSSSGRNEPKAGGGTSERVAPEPPPFTQADRHAAHAPPAPSAPTFPEDDDGS